MKNNVEVKNWKRVHWCHNWQNLPIKHELNFYVFLIVPPTSEQYSLSVKYTMNYLLGLVLYLKDFNQPWKKQRSRERRAHISAYPQNGKNTQAHNGTCVIGK